MLQRVPIHPKSDSEKLKAGLNLKLTQAKEESDTLSDMDE